MSTPEMSYEAAVGALQAALKFGVHPSLDVIRAMVRELGEPHRGFASIQVTGTNGKTSVSRLTAALLHAHGLRSGCYTSPHLQEYRERIEVDGEPISPAAFAASVAASLDAAAREGLAATEFELLTAAALHAFRVALVDFAVLEVGMGGRWDATSVVAPSVAVITGVALDHTQHLGATREVIAADKAQIIKPASAPVLGPGTAGVESILMERAGALDTHPRAVRASDMPSPMPEEMTVRFEVLAPPDRPGGVTRMRVRGIHADYGELNIAAPSYQAANVATAVAATEAALGRVLDPVAIAGALAAVRFPARFEVFPGDPLVIVDGSHNPEAAHVLAAAIGEAFGETSPRVLLGILADKDAGGIVEALAPVAGEIVVTAPGSARALPADELAGIVASVTGVAPALYPSVRVALEALAKPGEPPVVVAGSLTTAGEARSLLASR